jgi:hypothetical protein
VQISYTRFDDDTKRLIDTLQRVLTTTSDQTYHNGGRSNG